MSEPEHFRLCSTCKRPIPFESTYYVCSVSTCNRRATALYFCSVPCWDAHVPEARHRDAWAEQETAPSRAEWLEKRADSSALSGRSSDDGSGEPRAVRRVVSTGGPQAAAAESAPDDLPEDVLVVVSKLKKYVRARSGFNTSDGVVQVLSDHLRALCGAAIQSAARNSRKTVLDRDFEAVLSGKGTADE